MTDYTDDRRLLDIVATFVFCERPFTAEDVRGQFKYETKREPDADQLGRAMAKVKADAGERTSLFH